MLFQLVVLKIHGSTIKNSSNAKLLTVPFSGQAAVQRRSDEIDLFEQTQQQCVRLNQKAYDQQCEVKSRL